VIWFPLVFEFDGLDIDQAILPAAQKLPESRAVQDLLP
jgi:hypothetical protein